MVLELVAVGFRMPMKMHPFPPAQSKAQFYCTFHETLGKNWFQKSALREGNLHEINNCLMMSCGSTQMRHSCFVAETELKFCLETPSEIRYNGREDTSLNKELEQN